MYVFVCVFFVSWSSSVFKVRSARTPRHYKFSSYCQKAYRHQKMRVATIANSCRKARTQQKVRGGPEHSEFITVALLLTLALSCLNAHLNWGGGLIWVGVGTPSNTIQSPSMLNKNPTYSTKVTTKANQTKPQKTRQSPKRLDKNPETLDTKPNM